MMTTMMAEGMSRLPTYSPSPSTSQAVFYPHGDQAYSLQPNQLYSQPPSQIHPSQQRYMHHGPAQVQLHPQYMEFVTEPSGIHEAPHGRMAIPMQQGQGQGSSGMIMMKRRTGATPTPSPHHTGGGLLDCGPSPFLPMENSTPTMMHHSPAMMMHPALPQVVSPTDEMRHHQEMQRNHAHSIQMMDAQQRRPISASSSSSSQQLSLPNGRPPMLTRHSTQIPAQQGRPATLQRHNSLQPTHRSASPHIVQDDLFNPMPNQASVTPRPSSSLGLQVERDQPNTVQFQPDMFYYAQPNHGISPARALGPAPAQPLHFSPHQYDDPMITPHGAKTGYQANVYSSGATSSTATSSSSLTSASEAGSSSVDRNQMENSSDDENDDSPTKNAAAIRISKLEMDDTTPVPQTRSMGLPMSRPVRPTTKPTVIGGRTSAKFAKVAEDPGVEGVPDGPRPKERPGPSFACIIGQAILRCSAGGLSLEHIYRYVETAYPFFKTGDGAWRNSVRHNLSIHKMFETIPRTEKFPPGKGGIWIIHEEEKCHWPSEDKFIKNFPPSHPHHQVCRQTMHERQKEKEAIDKAAREGKVYVPKKGKKGRKLARAGGSAGGDDDDEGDEMDRSCSVMGDIQAPSSSSISASTSVLSMGPGPMPMPLRMMPSGPGQVPMYGLPLSHPHAIVTPQMQTKILHPSMPPPMMQHQQQLYQHLHHQQHPQMYPLAHSHPDLEDDGDFLPLKLDRDTTPTKEHVQPHGMIVAMREDNLARNGIMVPPRFERIVKEKRRPIDDEENVFTSSVKRVRVAEPVPLHPISLGADAQAQVQAFFDDSFITPERERPNSVNANGNGNGNGNNNPNPESDLDAKIHSSAFKTPALVNTSSSPGSSPMPLTMPRTAHHPSGLQQAWTQDDMSASVSVVSDINSSPRLMLDAAFEPKPQARGGGPKTRFGNKTSAISMGDDDVVIASGMPTSMANNNAKGAENDESAAGNGTFGGPPKTPVTRSSAAQERPQLQAPPQTLQSQTSRDKDASTSTSTPRLPLRTPMYSSQNRGHKTPIPMVFPGSPARAPPTVSALLSTPAWEMSGCLDRLRDQDVLATPTNNKRAGAGGSLHHRHHSLSSINGGMMMSNINNNNNKHQQQLPQTPRSPMPPTSPTRYAISLLDNAGSPRKRDRERDHV